MTRRFDGARSVRVRAAALAVVWAAWFAGAPAVAQARAVNAERIVSTSPSITETLFALGLGDRVVGVSAYCRFPEVVQQLPTVGTFLRPDVEVIARLRPDLVVVHPGSTNTPRQLAVLRIHAITVERGTLASVFSSMRQIGDAAGARDRATLLIREVTTHLDQVRASVASRPRRKVLIIVGRRPGTLTDLIAVGKGSYLSDLVEIAGGTNVLGDGSLPEFPRISMETVIRLAPDVIIDAGDMGDAPDVRQRRASVTLALWRRQRAVVAAATGSVYPAMSDAFVVPGPRVVEAAQTFAEWIHQARRR